MMKFRELTTEKKAVVVAANVVFFGALTLSLFVPSLPKTPLVCVEAASLAIELWLTRK
ncbi:MAG: hypothetical protein MJ116_06380 [Lachnospiraceae bacterium]|nr:hypothetical protein [Lachnospiraceae bacterium]